MENTTSAASPITGHTGLICLLGSPCAHSVSPMMHNASFEALGLDYRYLAFDVNEETLPTAVAGLKVLGARGFNLTMPDKNLMVSLCDELSTAARIIGAVNTVVNEDGRLIGHNTDGIGYMQSVKDAGYDIIGKKMTLLGAGRRCHRNSGTGCPRRLKRDLRLRETHQPLLRPPGTYRR